MFKPFRLPDGSIVFVGHEVICRTPPRIDVSRIRQKSFQVPAMPDQISPAVEHIMKCIGEMPLNINEERLGEFEIAISEAVNNAVTHDGKNPDRQVMINILFIPEVALSVGITDDLGPLEIKDLRLDMVDAAGAIHTGDRGRGFFIMCCYATAVSYFPENAPGKLKEILLTLSLDDSSEAK